MLKLASSDSLQIPLLLLRNSIQHLGTQFITMSMTMNMTVALIITMTLTMNMNMKEILMDRMMVVKEDLIRPPEENVVLD